MKHVNAWDLLDAIGEADERFVNDAEDVKRKKRPGRKGLRKYGILAACLLLAAALIVPAALLRRNDRPGGSDTSVGSWTEALRDYLIYYVDGSALSCISVRLQTVPQARFDAWKDANHIGDEVEFVGESTRDDSYQLTVSPSLRAYYNDKDDLLLQSLGKTMTVTEEEPYTGFELYLEGRAVYPDDYPEFVDKYDEQGRLIYSLRPWTDWSIEITEYDYRQGMRKTTYYCAEGGLEPDVTKEPEYTLGYVEEVRIDETGTTVGWHTRHTYCRDGRLDSITEYDENYVERLYTGYYGDGSVRARVERNERGCETKIVHFREDGSLEEHREIEYDEEGHDRKHIYYDEEGGVVQTECLLYTEEGHCESKEVYDADGVLISTIKYTYDEKGHQIAEATYRADGSLKHLTEYTYCGGIVYFERSEYEYDEEGNLVYEQHSDNDWLMAGIPEKDVFGTDQGE